MAAAIKQKKVYMELDAALAVGPLGRSVASAVGARVWPGQRGAVNVVRGEDERLPVPCWNLTDDTSVHVLSCIP